MRDSTDICGERGAISDLTAQGQGRFGVRPRPSASASALGGTSGSWDTGVWRPVLRRRDDPTNQHRTYAIRRRYGTDLC